MKLLYYFYYCVNYTQYEPIELFLLTIVITIFFGENQL